MVVAWQRKPSPRRWTSTLSVVSPRPQADSIGEDARQPRRLIADAGRFLTTVLMTDIVDSTQTVARQGDRRWRELLAVTTPTAAPWSSSAGGELVSTTGDGVIAIFDGPTRAVRAAIAIQAAARASGIAVRAGVHTGECERMPEGLAGVAVHITARICALAGADEVMTTGIVRDLVIGSLLDFEPRGPHELSGVPGEWDVFSGHRSRLTWRGRGLARPRSRARARRRRSATPAERCRRRPPGRRAAGGPSGRARRA